MPIDPTAAGTMLPATTMAMEQGRLRAFARATGQQDPVYLDPVAAREAGHPDLPVPPTFLFGIELEADDPFGWLADLGVDLTRVLHGEQGFTHHRMAHAGEVLTASPTIASITSKRGGAMELVVKQTAVTDADGAPVADLTTTIVVRNPEVAR